MILEPQSKFHLNDIETLISAKTGRLEFSKKALARVGAAHEAVQTLSRSKIPIYGVNTGFGRLAQQKIPEKDLVQLQINLLRSHACGIGKPLSEKVIRRLILLRAISLGKGHSGISPAILKRHLEYLNRGAFPLIFEQGSVGASGDLAPLSHLGLTFMGEGAFLVRGKEVSAKKLLPQFKWKALPIGPKEGLALVNGTQFSLALALEARDQLAKLIPWMEFAACLSIEGHRATAEVFRPELHLLKDHPEQQKVAERFRKILKNSPHMLGHEDCDLVQDSYSFRCIPQVLGPAYSILQKADELLTGEVNSVSDNPVFIPKTGELLSGGHFHAHSVSFASDIIAMAVATFGNLIERRIDQIVSPLTTRGTAFLADEPGVESGMMIIQTAAASLVSENKTLVHPASSDTVPTNGNQEDHVSMAPWGARKAIMMIENLRGLIAAEIIVGVRAATMEKTRTKLSYSPELEKGLTRIQKLLPNLFKEGDRIFSEDWRATTKLLR